MSFAARSLVVAALVGARAAQAQTPATPQPAPAQQAQPAPPSVVAGIPVNYDESKVGTYTLPDPLVTTKGERVRDAATWTRVRRPEILRMFESIQFGKAPGKPDKVTIDRFDTGTVALGGKAIRRQTTLYF